MKIAVLPVTPFAQNCSLLWCAETMRGAVTDPGGEVDKIVRAVEEQGVTVDKILITHGHIDHAGGAAELAERLSVPIEGPQEEDSFWIDQLEDQGQRFGFPDARRFSPDRWLAGGDTVSFGNVSMEVRHCPGHTPGHVIFFDAESNVAVVGDVLFKGSIGRTDFPRGDHEALIRSIREQLWPLGDNVVFVPGHGLLSTFGDERRNNPFVADSVLA